MPKQEGQKSKLLTLLRILEQKTDEEHLLNVPQLVELLEQQDILAERKSIYSDIDTLRSLGYDIQLQRQVYVDGRPKSDSHTLLYSIDALHSAINAGRMVRFRYKDGGTRAVSPWQLAWENGCYYLIAYQDEKEPAGIRNYRVDRMSSVTVLGDARRGKAEFRQFDLPAYLRKHFNMFGGPEHRVTLRCTADLESAMRDRFGKTPLFVPEEDGAYFHFDVPVCVSPQFYGWVCGFGGKVEVMAPAEVRKGIHDMVQALAKQHD